MTESTKPRRRGVYLLPNLFTTATLFSGFYSLIESINHQFYQAAVMIFVAMVADSLDGRVARMTNTQSEFGTQYDSLADLLAFGVAPAILLYELGLRDLAKFGWLMCFIYTAAVALRLARFNTQVHVADKRYFQGLACPAAAAVLAGAVWAAQDFHVFINAWLFAAIVLLVSLLQVSNFRYYSFKQLDTKHSMRFISTLVVVLVYVLVVFQPPLVLFISFLLYALSGPIWTLLSLRKMREGRTKA